MYVEDKIISLNLWDTAGQERFKSLIPSYIKDSAVAIVCYDITSHASFEHVETWIQDARALRDDEVLLVLVGNKADLADRRQVSTEEGQEYANQKNLMFFETSAKTGANIKTLFNEMAKKLTGIETNPINQAEEKTTGGFQLEATPADSSTPGGEDGQDGGKKKKRKQKCC